LKKESGGYAVADGLSNTELEQRASGPTVAAGGNIRVWIAEVV
jgi:hypothetical protein